MIFFVTINQKPFFNCYQEIVIFPDKVQEFSANRTHLLIMSSHQVL